MKVGDHRGNRSFEFMEKGKVHGKLKMITPIYKMI